ncbi:MGMT family protein [Massilistercora timonensis]|uniref:MGMT family protein n=1 Tax=Massilistercora timonensis TaxID=2086584 RepID=UPI00320B2CC8
MEEKSAFERIYEVIDKIPEGKVASYGQVAALAGNRRWARVVGYALHGVPEDRDLPCHRVVTKEGRISPAFGPGPDNRQARRLREEGVQVRDGFVDMEKFQWKKWIF